MPPPGADPLSPRARELFFTTGGNVKAVHRLMGGEGEPVPSQSALSRGFDRELTPAEVAFARTGAEGARARSVYLRWEPEHRADGYAADHKELSIEVFAPRARRPARPWVTLFLDEYSRLIVGWAISLRPSQAEVLAGLRMAVVVDPDRGSFGGVPLLLRFDGGLEFAARSVEDAAAMLRCVALRCRAYQPWLKGKIERLNRTVEQTLLCELPRRAHGPRRPNGQLADQREALTLERFVGIFDAWVRVYNTERPHDGLDGQTPLERWSQDARPVSALAAEDARWMLLPEIPRQVLKDGVHFAGLIYIVPELNGLVGDTVGIRAMPHDRRSIEIYHDGRWLGTAKPQGALSGSVEGTV
jgi:putative transposase